MGYNNSLRCTDDKHETFYLPAGSLADFRIVNLSSIRPSSISTAKPSFTQFSKSIIGSAISTSPANTKNSTMGDPNPSLTSKSSKKSTCPPPKHRQGWYWRWGWRSARPRNTSVAIYFFPRAPATERASHCVSE